MGQFGSQIQVPSRQINARTMIETMGRRCTAAIPIGNFFQTNI
jgi:hypothetical protein